MNEPDSQTSSPMIIDDDDDDSHSERKIRYHSGANKKDNKIFAWEEPEDVYELTTTTTKKSGRLLNNLVTPPTYNYQEYYSNDLEKTRKKSDYHSAGVGLQPSYVVLILISFLAKWDMILACLKVTEKRLLT